jgi:hypothetical protein
MIRLASTVGAILLVISAALIAGPASAGRTDLNLGETAWTPTAQVTVTTVGGDPYVKLCASSDMVVSTFTWRSDVGRVVGGTYPQRATPLSAGQCSAGTLTFQYTPSTVTYDPDNSAPLTWRLS